MIYAIDHWYRGDLNQPHPKAFRHTFILPDKTYQGWAVEVKDISKFVQEYKYPVMVCPATKNFPYFQIRVSDSWRFGQK
jgi:hypothetical protein